MCPQAFCIGSKDIGAEAAPEFVLDLESLQLQEPKKLRRDNKLKRAFRGLKEGMVKAQSRLDTKLRLENLRYSAFQSLRGFDSRVQGPSDILGGFRSLYSPHVRRGVEKHLPEIRSFKKTFSGSFRKSNSSEFADPYIYDLKVVSIEQLEKTKAIASLGDPDMRHATKHRVNYEVGLVKKPTEFRAAAELSRWEKIRGAATDWDFKIDPSGLLTGAGVDAKIQHGSRRFTSVLRQDGTHAHRITPFQSKNVVTLIENQNSKADDWVVRAWLTNPYWRKIHLHNYLDTDKEVVGAGLVYQNSLKTRLQVQTEIGTNSDERSLRIQLFHSI